MNERGKTVDTTYLSLDSAEERGFIHRDYIAHCLRWSHVAKVLSKGHLYQSTRLLDVGCGRELPLPKMLYSSRYILQGYYGVDAGPIEDAAAAVFDSGKFPLKVWERCNFLELDLHDIDEAPVSMITCFEVLEHVEPRMMIDMLRHMMALSTPDVRIFISTPCWNRTDCAANHVNEMTFRALGAVFEDVGLAVKNVYGTFASIRDYEFLLNPQQRDDFNRLREYYDTNFLSCIYAPMYPEFSRNCLWELSKTLPASRRFPELKDCDKPWGSSAMWEQMDVNYKI